MTRIGGRVIARDRPIRARARRPSGPATAIVTLAMVSLVAACGTSASPVALPTLEGTTWRAVSIAGREPPLDSMPTISFAAGRIQGSAACNSYSADARLEGRRLAVGEVVLSRMMCAQDRLALDGPFIGILQANDRIEVVDGRLVIAGPGGELVFVSQS